MKRKKNWLDKKPLPPYSQLEYPKEAKERKIEGMVVVNFIVTTCGTIEQIKVVRSLGGGCDEEAIRIIDSMNYRLKEFWTPAKQRGRTVNLSYNFPIRFKLD